MLYESVSPAASNTGLHRCLQYSPFLLKVSFSACSPRTGRSQLLHMCFIPGRSAEIMEITKAKVTIVYLTLSPLCQPNSQEILIGTQAGEIKVFNVNTAEVKNFAAASLLMLI